MPEACWLIFTAVRKSMCEPERIGVGRVVVGMLRGEAWLRPGIVLEGW